LILHIRPASLDDVGAIVEVAVAAWEVGFRGILPEYIDPRDAWDPDRVRARFSQQGGEVRRAVAELDGEIKGFVVFGPTRDTRAPRSIGEIWVLDVHPRAWRRGIGRALVAHALRTLRRAGLHEVTLWTPAESDRARSFYEACGFRHDHAAQRRESFGGALEVRYRISLGEPGGHHDASSGTHPPA